MDYSYYAAQNQQYAFVGLPPTPVHSYAPSGEDQSDVPDPYQAVNDFHPYDQSLLYHGNPYLGQQQPAPQPQPQRQQSPPLESGRIPLVGVPPVDSPNGVVNHGDYDNNEANDNRSSSEEKESLTPAQSRRKAQNRAAQRAFRERKEKHVKDLENRLNALSNQSSTVLSENERLKRELQKLATQNEILRATNNSGPNGSAQLVRTPSPVPGPQTYSPTDFQRAVGVDPKLHPITYLDVGTKEDGEHLLSAGATWDLIQSHRLSQKGMVDVGDVSRRLKGRAMCNGQGPAFLESEVIAAIEESAIGAADELI